MAYLLLLGKVKLTTESPKEVHSSDVYTCNNSTKEGQNEKSFNRLCEQNRCDRKNG